jgi:predicted N-acyltransferase
LIVRDGTVAKMTLLGLAPNVDYAYLAIFYSSIDTAISHRLETLWGGAGTYDLKERFGFQINESNSVRYAPAGTLLRRLAALIPLAKQ